MAMANMNLIGVFVTKLWPVQALAAAAAAAAETAETAAAETAAQPKP